LSQITKLLDIGKKLMYLLEQALACARECHPGRGTREQGKPQFFFQRPYLRRQGWLRGNFSAALVKCPNSATVTNAMAW